MQVLDLITDASIYEPSLGIGAVIARLNVNNDTTEKKQILKGIWLFDAKQSFEAELLCGIFSIQHLIKSETIKQTSSIQWICDLPYLNELLKRDRPPNNKRLEELLDQVREMSIDIEINLTSPTTSSQKKYHNYCHRACSATRSSILSSPQSKYKLLENLSTPTQWPMIENKTINLDLESQP